MKLDAILGNNQTTNAAGAQLALKAASADAVMPAVKTPEAKTLTLYLSFYAEQVSATKNTAHLESYFLEGYADRGTKDFNGKWAFESPDAVATVTIDGIQGKLMLDLNGNDRVDTGAELLTVYELVAMDNNRDGLINLGDAQFKNLKMVIDDNQGGYQTLAISAVMNFIGLNDYVGENRLQTRIYEEERQGQGWTDSVTAREVFMRYADPVYTYDRFDKNDLNKMLSTQITDENGWIVRGKETESFFKNIAYARQTMDGGFYLQKTNAAVQNKMWETPYVLANGARYESGVNEYQLFNEQASRFNALYNRYHELLAENSDRIAALQTALKETDIGIDPASVAGFKTKEMANLEKEFERITQMDFTLKNMEKIKRQIEQGKAIESFSDLDIVIGLKQDGDGYRLRFNSGREIYVSSLYFNTGDFLGFEGNKRISTAFDQEIAKLDGNQDGLIDETEADYSTLAIKVDDKITLLKEAGVKMIHQKYFEDNDRLLLLLEFEDGTQKQANGFYRVIDMSEQFKVSGAELKGLLGHPYRESSSVIKADVARV